MTVEDHPQVLMCLHLGLLLEETYIASQVLHILTVSGYTIIKTTGDTLWDDDNNFCAGVSGCMSLVFTRPASFASFKESFCYVLRAKRNPGNFPRRWLATLVLTLRGLPQSCVVLYCRFDLTELP